LKRIEDLDHLAGEIQPDLQRSVIRHIAKKVHVSLRSKRVAG